MTFCTVSGVTSTGRKALSSSTASWLTLGRVTSGARPVRAGTPMLTNTAAHTVMAMARTRRLRFF